MPRDPHLDDLHREHMSGLEDKKYESEVVSTAEGRKSAELRRAAVELAARGQQEAAHALLLQAVALHPEDDRGAAAASARHDLGHSFTCRQLGVRVENLLAATRLYRAALACPPRANHPFRAVQTQSSLALCLRDLGAEHPDPEQSIKLLDEAEGLLRQAASTAEQAGAAGWTLAARCFVNLGNLLLHHREDNEAAISAYRTALDLHRRVAERAPHHRSRDEHDLAAIAAARAYLQRERKGDVQKALELAKRGVSAGDAQNVDTARLVAAEAWLKTNDRQRKEKALEQLDKINFSSLAPQKIRGAADLFRRLDERDRAIELMEGIIHRTIRDRTQAKADHDADEAAFRAQQAAAEAARLYVEKRSYLDALLVLENSSALRFIEAASTYTWRPADPMARELLRELRRLQSEAVTLDQIASMLERIPPDHWPQVLSDASARVTAAGSAEHDPSDALRLVEECRHDAAAVERFRREAHARIPAVDRVMAILMEQYPEARAALHGLEDVVDRQRLDELLGELPGHVLLRISLAKDLLVVAAWRENGKLTAKAHRLRLHRDLWRLLKAAPDRERAQARRELSALLEQLDLSPALPDRGERAVVLPSSAAAFLPIAALGPRGKRLLDRFDSIIWLPSLYPLRTRQDAHPPRAGTLIVTPGGTNLRDLAIGDTGPDELRLDGAYATRARLLEHATTADVVCFYTHGHHAHLEGPSVELADGAIGTSDLLDRCVGLERVELWACETGVSLPADPLTSPGVDEPFGLDFDFLRLGARSAIGTLWPVPEIVTAALVRRHRQLVASGCDPARALADAQRWWLAEGLQSLLDLLATRSPASAITEFAASLGGVAIAGDVLGMLGPTRVADAPMDRSEIERLREHLICPVSWAGVRFVGVPDRRPRTPWTDEHARPADEDLKQEVRRLIESPVQSRAELEEWRAGELEELAERTPGAPTPEDALAAARLFRDRITSSHAHNLLAGLAWLHEALASEALAAEVRAGLAIEAAHLWLDLAASESMHPALGGPAMGARARARALIEGAAGDDLDLATARARLAYLDALDSVSKLADATRRSWEILGGEFGPPDLTHAAIRRAIAACEWFVAAPDAVAGAAKRVLDHADELLRLLPDLPPDNSFVAPVARLVEVRHALAFRLELPPGDDDRFTLLTPRELVRATLREARQLAIHGPPAGEPILERLSQSLGQMEGALWGWPSDRIPLVSSSGATGRAYRDLLGHYTTGKAKATNEAPHVIACLQYACDLRLALRHHAMRLASAQPLFRDVLAEAFWAPLHVREILWAALSDAVELIEPGARRPPALDPFTRPARALQNETRSAIDATSWVLGELCSWRADNETDARTAAYQAVRMAEKRTRAIERTWKRLREVETALAEQQGIEDELITKLLDPGIVLRDNEEWLRRLPAGRGILALSLDEHRGLVGACLWRDERGPGQRLLHVDDGSLPQLLLELVRARETDNLPTQGQCAERQEAWTRLDRWLSPHLHELMGDGLNTRLHWLVLAPGALRLLPLLGLHAGKQCIAAHVESLVHVPSLGFSKVPSPSSGVVRTACLLARNRDDGDTSFGEAAIETLRRAAPPDLIVDPSELRGRAIVEVETLEPAADGLALLRLYGVGMPESINPTTAALRLVGRRGLGSHNVAGLRLGLCESVELWAGIAGGSDVLTLLRNDGDRLPGLVADFLAAGARGVLDLAWPIPDLVKAMVCEQYGFARSKLGYGPAALRYAVVAVAGVLGEWADQARTMTLVPEALSLLDSARRWMAVEIHRVDASCIVPFADHSDAPSLAGLTVTMLLEEMLHPSHLAAFRWWGL